MEWGDSYAQIFEVVANTTLSSRNENDYDQNVIEHILIGVGKSVDFSDCILHTDEHAQKVPSRGYNTLDRYLVPANNLPQEYLDQPLTRAQNAALCAASSVPTSATTRTDEH
ncbi:hypothetical protein PV326_011516 [Microctonus aethiopoides]|nr:hypothetical protein PV326_011516 [Microctonus aethiopoides]